MSIYPTQVSKVEPTIDLYVQKLFENILGIFFGEIVIISYEKL